MNCKPAVVEGERERERERERKPHSSHQNKEKYGWFARLMTATGDWTQLKSCTLHVEIEPTGPSSVN